MYARYLQRLNFIMNTGKQLFIKPFTKTVKKKKIHAKAAEKDNIKWKTEIFLAKIDTLSRYIYITDRPRILRYCDTCRTLDGTNFALFAKFALKSMLHQLELFVELKGCRLLKSIVYCGTISSAIESTSIAIEL